MSLINGISKTSFQMRILPPLSGITNNGLESFSTTSWALKSPSSSPSPDSALNTLRTVLLPIKTASISHLDASW